MTHTYVVMELSEAAYREIADQMRAAGYDHAFGSDGEIDMHGIAVACQPGLTPLTAASCGKPQSVFGGIRLCRYPEGHDGLCDVEAAR